MNYLAHAYLSFDKEPILIGNMIADYVKGKQIDKYPDDIKQGIIQHRHIDNFTDSHPTVKETKYIFRQSAGRYDASFLDIAYDYFLANNTTYKPSQGWLQFTLDSYNIIDNYSELLPADFTHTYKYMKDENWLYNYRQKKIIRKNFIRFANHLSYLPQKDHLDIFHAFEDNIEQLQSSFDSFFPDLIAYVQSINKQ